MNKYIIENNTINLSNFLNFVKESFNNRFKIIIALVLLNCIGIIFGVGKYSANVSFYSEFRESSSSSSMSFFDQIISGQGQLNFNIGDYINSDRFLESIVVDEFMINGQNISLANYWYDRKQSPINPITYIKKIDNFLHLSQKTSKEELHIYKAKRKLQEKLKYSEDRKSGMHTISITMNKYPDLSVQVMEKVYASIVSFSNKVPNAKASEKKAFISSRLNEIQLKLSESEQELVNFIINNKSYLQSPTLSLEKERIEREIALQSQLFIRLSDELELAKIDEKDNTTSIFILQEPKESVRKAGGNVIFNIIKTFISICIFVLSIELFLKRRNLFNFK